MSNQFKPCPFCGEKTDLGLISTGITRRVHCNICYAQGPNEILRPSGWNNRPDIPTEHPGLVAVYQIWCPDFGLWADATREDTCDPRVESRCLFKQVPEEENRAYKLPKVEISTKSSEDKTRQICEETVGEMFRVALQFLNEFVEHCEQKRDKTPR